MEYTVEITIPESRDEVFMAIFDALVAEPDPVAAVGDMKTTGAPSHLIIAVDAPDAHLASATAVKLFRDAVASSGTSDAEAEILGLKAEPLAHEERLDPNQMPAT